jgi:methyl-accepting chemotaxis protein
MLDKLPLRTRLMAVVLVALLGVLALAAIAAFNTRSLMLDERKGQIRAITQGAYNIAAYYQGQEAAGKLSREEAQAHAKDAVRQIRFNGPENKSDYFYIWTPEGINVMHAIKPEWEGKSMGDQVKDGNGRLIIRELAVLLQTQNSAYMDTQFIKTASDPATYPKVLYAQKFAPWNWMIGTGVYIDEVDKEFKQTLIYQGTLALVVLSLIGAICLLVTRSVLRQIGGEPALATTIMHQVAAGDLRTSIGHTEPGSLLHALDKMVLSLRQMLGEINQDALTLAANSQTISKASSQMAQTTGAQADATSSMAAAIEELTVSSSHISDSAEETQGDSRTAVEVSQQGRERAEEAASAMQRLATTVSDGASRIRTLEQQANQISSIAGVIKEIANQTNLLALNAAIEAARAGETGRGFAVVADEVRKLAERTSTATVEIEQMIAKIQSETNNAVQTMDDALPQVEQGVSLAQAAAESLTNIEAGARRTLEHIQDVANAIREQSGATTSIAQRVEAIAQTVEETSTTMNSTVASAQDLENVANNLKQLVSRFQI